MTAIKCPFGDFLSMAREDCEWGVLEYPTTQKFYALLDTLQKTTKDASEAETQQFVDKAKHDKLPAHVKKILNRAYLQNKTTLCYT